jgi:hypothetical protein
MKTKITWLIIVMLCLPSLASAELIFKLPPPIGFEEKPDEPIKVTPKSKPMVNFYIVDRNGNETRVVNTTTGRVDYIQDNSGRRHGSCISITPGGDD